MNVYLVSWLCGFPQKAGSRHVIADSVIEALAVVQKWWPRDLSVTGYEDRPPMRIELCRD